MELGKCKQRRIFCEFRICLQNLRKMKKGDWRLADKMNVTQTMLHGTLRGTKMLTEGCVKHAVKL